VRTTLLLLLLLPFWGFADTKPKVPAPQFQGVWDVQRHFFRTLREGATDFDALGEESPKGKFPPRVEIRFRRDQGGAIQQFWSDNSGQIVRSKGITIFKHTESTVSYRAWSDHPSWKTILTLKPDGTAVLQVRSLKHQETFILHRNHEVKPREKASKGGQGAAADPPHAIGVMPPHKIQRIGSVDR